MGGLQPIHLLLVLIIILVLFGGAKLPQLMRGMGQSMGEFKKGLDESKKEMAKTPAPEPESKEPVEADKK